MGNSFRQGKPVRKPVRKFVRKPVRMEFIVATARGDLELIRYAAEKDKEDGLAWAAGRGHLELVRYLVEQCDAGVNVLDTWQDSALLEAATWGHLAVVQYLAERCDANLTFSKALKEAASKGHVDVVQYLVEQCDADVNAKDELERTALMLAASFDFVEVVRYLVEQRAVDGITNALTEGASHGRLNVVRYLVEQCGVDVNVENEHGRTAVMAAITNCKMDLLRYLVEEGNGDVNSKAARLAADGGDIGVQRILTPFLLAETGDTTRDCGDVVLSSGIPSSCSIPLSEVELTLFHENGSIGGDFLAKWLGSDVVVRLPFPDACFDDEVRLWQQLRHPKSISSGKSQRRF